MYQKKEKGSSWGVSWESEEGGASTSGICCERLMPFEKFALKNKFVFELGTLFHLVEMAEKVF